jgi:ADP-ribose pyrophosphatase YjhB (NUDIX family)
MCVSNSDSQRMTKETFQCLDRCCEINLFTNITVSKKKHKPRCRKAGVFIYDPKEDKVLLVRSRGHMWGPPKGTIEELKNESMFDCAVREVKEETGLNINSNTFSKLLRIRNKAFYYYAEHGVCNVQPLDHEDNDVNGITWIKVKCLQTFLKNNQMVINQHCRILLEKFLNKVVM